MLIRETHKNGQPIAAGARHNVLIREKTRKYDP